MFNNYFVIALRNLRKHKYSVGISVFGLAVAFACSIVAYFNYEMNTTFDALQLNRADIYRINFRHTTSTGVEEEYGICPIPLGGLLRENGNLVDVVVRYETADREVNINNEIFKTEVVFTDPEFLEVFTLPMIRGTNSIAGTNLLLSDQLAEKYFGREDPVGQSLTLIVDQQPIEFNVSGVFKNFGFSNSFHFQMLTHLDNFYSTVADKRYKPDNWKLWNTTFLAIQDKSKLPIVEASLQQYVQVQNLERPDLKVSEFYLDPFEGMAERARASHLKGHWFGQPLPPAAVIVLFVISAVLLLVACVNLTNTTLAMAGSRLKEIGLRKVLGGRRKDLRIQFLLENFLLCLLSLGIGFLLAEYFLPAWDALWPDLTFDVSYITNIPFLTFIISVTLLATFISGAYPAFYISSFEPLKVLKGKLKFGGTTLLTRVLLVLQLSISLVAIIFNLSFYNNTVYQERYDLGFDSHQVIQMPVKNQAEFDMLKFELAKNPMIKSISGSEHHISASTYKGKIKVNQVEREVDMLNVGDHYMETVNLRLLEGRSFEVNSTTDQLVSVLVNEEFVKSFKLQGSGIGTQVTLGDSIQLFIVGIVKDVYLNALFQPVQPIVFRYSLPDSYQFLTVRADQRHLLEVQQETSKIWKELLPNRIYEGKMMDEEMAEALQHFRNVTILYSFLGAVTLLLSMSGLFSLITLHIQKRLKEIGLRKMMGASIPQLLWLAGKPFLIIITIACLLGTAGGLFSANTFMNAIWEYYKQTSLMTILISLLSVLIIAALSVAYRINQVRTVNPVDIIREE